MLELKLFSGGKGLDLFPFVLDCPKGIFVVFSGEGSALFNGCRTAFGAGGVFFLDPAGSFVVLEGEVVMGYLLCFEQGYIDYFLSQYPLARSLSLFGAISWLPIEKDKLAILLERIRVIVSEIERGVAFDQLKLAFAMFLLDIIGERIVVAKHFDEASEVKDVFRTLLEENFRKERSSVFYAERMCITPRKLNEYCRGWFAGKRFDGVMRDRLLSEAEFLLLGSDNSIKAIAFGLGFCSLQHFRGWFKKLKGMSPTMFRNTFRP